MTIMPQLIAVALYHRDHFSKGNARRTFGYMGYHWTIVIMPREGDKGDRYVFDATDASYIDPATFRLTNPAMDWRFRVQEGENPALAAKLLGHLVIGQVPDGVSLDELDHFFSTVPLPVKDSNPQESCVTWVLGAIEALQQRGWVSDFELGRLKDTALSYADERLKDEDAREADVRHYKPGSNQGEEIVCGSDD